MRTVHGHESPLQLRTQTVRRPDACGCGLPADVKFVDPHTSGLIVVVIVISFTYSQTFPEVTLVKLFLAMCEYISIVTL